MNILTCFCGSMNAIRALLGSQLLPALQVGVLIDVQPSLELTRLRYGSRVDKLGHIFDGTVSPGSQHRCHVHGCICHVPVHLDFDLLAAFADSVDSLQKVLQLLRRFKPRCPIPTNQENPEFQAHVNNPTNLPGLLSFSGPLQMWVQSQKKCPRFCSCCATRTSMITMLG